MGVNWQYVKVMEQQGLLGRGKRVLDIGSSNLYCATADELYDFVVRHNPERADEPTRRQAERWAAGSTYVPGKGGTNEAFVGEVFEAAGMEYLSFDIAKGYKTEVLDFNREALPGRHRGAWDVVLNFGTTEHVFNQLNSFKILHDATALGGYLYHQLPAIGFVDHCYFTYTGRFFFDMAGYNEYRVVDFWFGEPGGNSTLYESVVAYSSYFPALGEFLQRQRSKGRHSAINGPGLWIALKNRLRRLLGRPPLPIHGIAIPNICINVIYQKVKDRPFLGAIEMQTSVGEIPDEVRDAYAHPEKKSA